MNALFNKVLIAVLLLTGVVLYAQQTPRYWNEILMFKHLDTTTAIPPKPILFIGSSSFTNWKTICQDFKEYPILNRAFGGAVCTDLIRYFYEVVAPYQPKQIFIYCGDNDLGFLNLTPQQFMLNFKTLFAMIRIHFPTIEINFVSIKPSPFHRPKQDSVKKTNALVKSFLQTEPHTQYINTYATMLDKNGNIRSDIFIEDSLHMNWKGYEIWIQTIRPYLKK